MAGNANSGRRPKPPWLKKLRGNPGGRPVREEVPPTLLAVTEPPSQLSEAAKARWLELVPVNRRLTPRDAPPARAPGCALGGSSPVRCPLRGSHHGARAGCARGRYRRAGAGTAGGSHHPQIVGRGIWPRDGARRSADVESEPALKVYPSQIIEVGRPAAMTGAAVNQGPRSATLMPDPIVTKLLMPLSVLAWQQPPVKKPARFSC